jgi:glucose-6-phosphate 1-dehydrogenase
MTTLVIFGAAGDLAGKKLLPAVYELARRNLLPMGFSLVGVDHTPWREDQFLTHARDAVKTESASAFDEGCWQALSSGIRYLPGSVSADETFVRLRTLLSDLSAKAGVEPNYAYYLALPPELFGVVSDQLGAVGLGNRAAGWSRIVVEKPFGTSGDGANALKLALEQTFATHEIFRIDHYLAKPAVQQIPKLRFGAAAWQQLLAREQLDHVQITIAEDDGVGDRIGFYDATGAARDVLQNHLVQLLALAAMEEPASTAVADLQAAKDAVLAAVEVPDDIELATARGQYAAGGKEEPGYLQQLANAGRDAASMTETFVALRLSVHTERWQGIPFYLRTGKRLFERITEIAYILKAGRGSVVFRIQPDAAVEVRLGDLPAQEIRVSTDEVQGYARLILDVLSGQTELFSTQSEVLAGWRLVDPLLQHWGTQSDSIQQYEPGSWGPASAGALIARDGRTWRNG